MKPTTHQLAQAFPDIQSAAGRLHFLDTRNPEEVVACEQCFYESFHPVLKINPLLRDIWIWDDSARRLQVPVPPEAMVIPLLSDPASADIRFATAVTLCIKTYWQAGIFGFPLPPDPVSACEFTIMARGHRGPFQHGVPVRRDYVRRYLLGGLARLGFHSVWATTADHLLPLYRWLGATFQDKRVYHGHNRTLLRWELP